jgi:chromatin remodeling complex protein RSC6
MLRPTHLSFAITAVLMLGAVANADVYKSVDAKGNVEYTDKPASLPAQRLNVQTQKTDQASTQARADEERKRQEADDKQQQKPSDKGAAKPSPDKGDACDKAKARSESYQNSPRLYEDLGNGERRYLTDAELDAARASAKATMDAVCGKSSS